MKKRIIATVVAILIMASSVFAFASESNDVSELELLQNNQQLQVEICAYFNAKLSNFSNVCTYSVGETLGLRRNIANRANGLMEMQERAEIEFANIDIDSEIRNVLEQSEEKLVLDVYEWTTIEYYASSNSMVTDVMGYGINHEMTFDVVNGEYILVEDSFDERNITGVCSQDKLVYEDKIELCQDVTAEGVPDNRTRSIYNVQNVINYANTYCGIALSNQDYSDFDGVTSAGNNKTLYNTAEYTVYSGRDCANFVSQCLYAGGLTTDTVWKKDSYAWVNAAGLANYLITNRGYSSYPASPGNYSNVYPGNPVYWINPAGSSASGHQMICTGYNSAGIPVVSGHNSDMFRYPISLLDHEGHEIKTIQIVNSDQHLHAADGGYNITASSHYHICKYCRDVYDNAAHNVVTIGGSQRCSICFYGGPFASYHSLSTCGDLDDLPDVRN